MKNTNNGGKGDIITSNIYRWDVQNLRIMDKLAAFGSGAGLTQMESTWSANEIDVEYLSDKSGEYRAVKKDTDLYLTNTECVILNKFFTANPQT